MTAFSGLNRSQQLEDMSEQSFDLLVIGGGITGCGIALDATTRGIKTALVEMQDFAAGTSSRSTKLVHGGLRYLKQFEVKMVAEVGKERAIVYENGPHVTTPEWMLLPMHKGGTFGKFSTSIGLRLYDFLANVKRGERRKMLNNQQAIDKEPLLKREGLLGGGYYVEYRTDDARLTIEVIKEAVKRGAKAVNYAKVEAFIYRDGKVIGVRVHDQISGKTYELFAKKIVNAAGPWVDTLREKDHSKKGKSLQLTKGVHLVIDQKRFPLKQAVYFDTPDGRMVFAIPRNGKAYVGTTDTFYGEDPVSPKMTVADRTYIIDAINYMFPKVNITEKDIESSWAGVRPLILEEGKDPSEISRKDEIWQSESGLITIAGGKLTGYRKMAETIVDLVASLLGKELSTTSPACKTKHLPISGGDVGGSAHFASYIEKMAQEGIKKGFTPQQAGRLARTYGSNVNHLFDKSAGYNQDAAATGLPLDLYASLVYGLEQEMVYKPVDFFIRRTGYLFFDIDMVYKWKTTVIEFMAERLKWSKEEKEKYVQELEVQLHDAVVPIDDRSRSNEKGFHNKNAI
ncbi:glycerol-3-phosphate dehydrogenase/oxidase [Aneurinibacillus sp. Ricciae_BoGa-3]|uniref:glycerol-3-phosphate dehydrogenase/oxidase n=1 Tax=Aneurinibacillus sp. Ricciae_BoGa-3 TaxID=3022697 RepID=UPI00234048CF|nr:glycerol-3-phosphate dehydrogenase/oxidase [Aneurinibacillus sp. Ricciae_BoGa-3]WCK53528.1 glycerol-3-phosphate dehydrogenase/oxidase [Aneurinibacillus sp. Ricciae_BoGa-3]